MANRRMKIGAFDTFDEIAIRQFPNGGWVVCGTSGAGQLNARLGAYGSAREMLGALASALIRDDDPVASP